MIRNVVLGRLRPATDATQRTADSAQLDRALKILAELPFDGMIEMRLGRDLQLRPGGWSFAITNDWVDEQAYLRYDADAEHNRVRRELIGPICEQIARVQFTVDR